METQVSSQRPNETDLGYSRRIAETQTPLQMKTKKIKVLDTFQTYTAALAKTTEASAFLWRDAVCFANAKQQEKLERYMQISEDLKKEIFYNKHTGKWSWRDRGCKESHGEFATFFDALCDVVSPYLENEE
jgi:hypothetical protein